MTIPSLTLTTLVSIICVANSVCFSIVCLFIATSGEKSTVNEKGTSALLTVELDKEKGPQIRVEPGKEPPAFLQLFGGSMIILNGK